VALLGELCAVENSQNHIPQLERIAYSTQDAFIMPGTLRDNIIFGRDYNEAFYQQTIKACALEEDFDAMQSGDRTKVMDARALSGGQKQRIVRDQFLASLVFVLLPLYLDIPCISRNK
jgi:ABC-type transport system involved in cytochrome bd biosynthesis fused ATPase/permease subunit